MKYLRRGTKHGRCYNQKHNILLDTVNQNANAHLRRHFIYLAKGWWAVPPISIKLRAKFANRTLGACTAGDYTKTQTIVEGKVLTPTAAHNCERSFLTKRFPVEARSGTPFAHPFHVLSSEGAFYYIICPLWRKGFLRGCSINDPCQVVWKIFLLHTDEEMFEKNGDGVGKEQSLSLNVLGESNCNYCCERVRLWCHPASSF